MNFPDQMAAMKDDELYAVMAHKGDYIEEAISAAEAEFQRRGLDPAQIPNIQEKRNAARTASSDEPLSKFLAIVFFLFPYGLPQFLAAERFRQIGALRKARETWRSMWLGLGFYALMILLGIIQRM